MYKLGHVTVVVFQLDIAMMKISEGAVLVHGESILHRVQWGLTYFMHHRERANMELRAMRLLPTEDDDLATPDRHVQ